MNRFDAPAQTVEPGDILAEKYRVERVLGQGGMGFVVLAEHLELRERVAIKFLLDSAADNAELSERFLREARAAVKIKSEHVVRVIDVGKLPSGAPYMVMEYLEGEDLSQRLLAGRVPIEDAVDYVIQCCEAMHVAHRSGIVHRDLKPANLFLTQRPDGSALIKVLDFGISKVKSPDAGQLSLTHTQAMMGSPLYMSPEQMRSPKDVSPAADIWSLGVILHELIAGDVPFTGGTFPEVLVQVMNDAPPRLRPLRPEVPEGLEAVVLRCLEKDPAARFSSVAALAVALSPFASTRTLGLQARLRTSVSRPAPAVPAAPVLLVQSTQVVVDGAVMTRPAAIASTAPPPVPPPSSLPEGRGAAPLREHAKTNTAWAEQSARAGASGAGSRRRWVLVGATLAAAGFAGVLLLARPGAPPGASEAPRAEPTLAAPAAERAPAIDVAPTPPPQGAPLAAPIVVALPAEPEPEAPADVAPTPRETTAARSEDHPPAVAPTAAVSSAGARASGGPGAARRKTRAGVKEGGARARTSAAASAPASANAPAAGEPRPAPAQPTPPKSNPLSIEFK